MADTCKYAENMTQILASETQQQMEMDMEIKVIAEVQHMPLMDRSGCSFADFRIWTLIISI